MSRAITLAGVLLLALLLPTLADAATVNRLVNMGSGPGMKYPAFYVVWPGWPLVVHSCGRYWCKVTYQGVVNGWVSALYINRP